MDISGIYTLNRGEKPRIVHCTQSMFIDNYLPEPLGLQKMQNDSTFLLFYHFWFHVFELLTIAAEAGNGFYWDEVQGTTKLKSLNRVVRDITCGFPRRPGNVVLQKELYFLPTVHT